MDTIEIEHFRRVSAPTVGVFRQTHKEIFAVEDTSFGITFSELFGLLGPNGAGYFRRASISPSLGTLHRLDLTQPIRSVIIPCYQYGKNPRQLQKPFVMLSL